VIIRPVRSHGGDVYLRNFAGTPLDHVLWVDFDAVSQSFFARDCSFRCIT